MIKEIKITNFYSFNESTITLHPDTNILIGINGSGKSNFLKAVRLLKEGIAGVGLQKHIMENLGGFDNSFFKGTHRTTNANIITIQYRFDGEEITKGNYGFRFTDDIIYRISLVKSPSLQNFYVQEHIADDKGFVYLDFKNGVGYLTEKNTDNNKTGLVKYADYDPQGLVLKEVSDTDRYFALTTIRKAIRDILVYDYFDTTPKSPIRKAMLSTSDKRLVSDGTNLPQILNTIKINYKQQYRRIVEMLNEVNPNFVGFDFNFISGNSSIELMLEEEVLDSSIHVSSISDGTLRYLCLLSILYNPERGRFICIDEPEVGLHPDMILNISNAIREASENSTLVISTHSDNLLNYFDIENVKVFEKDENNATKVISYNKAQFSDWYSDFSLGQMWKQGDLGGVRYGS
jgi:predicted ATPase